jgi:hypothetical protein
MVNHKIIPISYNASAVYDVLNRHPLAEDNKIIASYCNSDEVEKISQILNLNLPIMDIICFNMGKTSTGVIHKDCSIKIPVTRLIGHALNIPIMHCESVYMNWFNQIDLNVESSSYVGALHGQLIPSLDHNNATCIDTVNCNNVNLVAVNDWHSVDNRSTTLSACLISVRFKRRVTTSMILPINEWIVNDA